MPKSFSYFIVGQLLLSFSFSYTQGTWLPKKNMPGFARALASTFTLGGKEYLGTGSEWPYSGFMDDFWEYNPAADTWSQKASFGGGVRDYAIGFSVGTKGYMGTGLDNTYKFYKDLWEYDPALNTWTQKANLPGPARSEAFAFGLGNYGYIGTGLAGQSSYLSDLWQYDPATNSWAQKSNYSGGFRIDIDRAVFIIGSKAYLGTGWEPPGNKVKDFWEYDQLSDSWTQKADFAGPPRYGAAGFSICDKGYLGFGQTSNGAANDLWMYYPAQNLWKQMSSLPGPPRVDAQPFAINGKGYIATGAKDTSGTVLLSDLWEFTPPAFVVDAGINPAMLSVCAGSITTLTVSGGSNYSWNTGDTTSAIIISPTATATYSVIVSAVCYRDTTLSSAVTTFGKGEASFVQQYDPCSDKCVLFTDQSINAFTWHWDYGDGVTSSVKNECHFYQDSAAYSISLIVNRFTTCADTFSLAVSYAIRDTSAFVYIPNAFSPNADGCNDLLQFFRKDAYCLKEFELAIYDRWGEKVFETTNINDTWDGMLNGEPVNSSVLAYYCKTVTAAGLQQVRKGSIAVVR